MVDRVEIPGRFSAKSSKTNNYENLWFKFPFFFEGRTCGKDMYKRMLKFLYKTAYKDPLKQKNNENYNDY